MFQLLGIIEQGTTLVGTFEKDGKSYLVGVSLVENLSKAKAKAVQEDVKSSLTQPDIYLSNKAKETLAANFANRVANVLSVDVKSPEQAAFLIDGLLQTDYHRFHFVCTDRQTYLTICTELAMSKQDFFRFAELKALLSEGPHESKSVIGSAHKLITAIKNRQLYIPFWEDRHVGNLENMIEALTDAEKIWVVDDKWDPANDDFLYYPGDYRLPFNKCLFEYKATSSHDKKSSPVARPTNYLMVYDHGGVYVGYIYQYNPEYKIFTFTGFGPSWSVDRSGNISGHDLVMIDKSVGQFYLSEGMSQDYLFRQSYSALRRIGATLAAMNQPRASEKIYTPPPGLQNARKTKVPFFKYREIVIDPLKSEDGTPVCGNALQGREGVALHRVKGHLKPSVGRWVFPYNRGDARYGVVLKGFRDEGVNPPGLADGPN